MLSSVSSFGLSGMESFSVSAEVDTSRGLPHFEIVGLPDAAVKESRDRVRAAVRNNGLSFPHGRIIVNLAPAATRKLGAVYDLPILLGILQCEGQLEADLAGMAFVGELSLSGEIRPVNGVLPMALSARAAGIHTFFVPAANAAEGASATDIEVYGVNNIAELLAHLSGERPLERAVPSVDGGSPPAAWPDFADVKGQEGAKRALEIAAAGGHNLLFIGPPGSGKSMLAKRLPSILPPLVHSEAIETTQIHSVAGVLAAGTSLVQVRPFRSPHHTVSPAGLAGGGSTPRPGEISLAHNGVLFLDELPEFSRQAMEVLRQPLEDGIVSISRAGARLTYPSRFMLVAAMNPCPCGNFGHPQKNCTCSPQAVARYLGKVSGPLLDRLDMHIEVSPVPFDSLRATRPEESSATVRARVMGARALQEERYRDERFHFNSAIPAGKLQRYAALSDEAAGLLRLAFDRLGLSARGYERVLKLARTIADLAGEAYIAPPHISEAVQYRSLDRKYWSDRRG